MQSRGQSWFRFDARSKVITNLSIRYRSLSSRNNRSRNEMPLIIVGKIIIESDVKHGGFFTILE